MYPRGPWDRLLDDENKTWDWCDCKDCVEYRKNHTRKEWLKELRNDP